MYKVTGIVTGKGIVEKTIVASSAKEAKDFFKKELNSPKVSVTVVSVILESEIKKSDSANN